MNQTFLACSLIAALSGCASCRPPNTADLSAVSSATPANEGTVKLFGGSVWRPNAIGFRSSEQDLAVGGMLVFTDKSILWQRCDAGKLNIAKKISFADIHVVALAESGLDRLIVVQGKDYRYDSFALTQGRSLLGDPGKTAAGYQTLLDLLYVK